MLYKADGGRLASLERVRSEGEVKLLRHDLNDAEQAAFLGDAEARLRELEAALEGGLFRVVGQVPADGDVVRRARTWLAARPRPMRVATMPHAR